MIDKKLALLAHQVEGAEEGWAAAIKAYWHTRTRLLEIEWRQQVERLVETAVLFLALDGKTGRQLGHRLYESVLGLRVPAISNDDYPQPVKLAEPDNGALGSPGKRTGNGTTRRGGGRNRLKGNVETRKPAVCRLSSTIAL